MDRSCRSCRTRMNRTRSVSPTTAATACAARCSPRMPNEAWRWRNASAPATSPSTGSICRSMRRSAATRNPASAALVVRKGLRAIRKSRRCTCQLRLTGFHRTRRKKLQGWAQCYASSCVECSKRLTRLSFQRSKPSRQPPSDLQQGTQPRPTLRAAPQFFNGLVTSLPPERVRATFPICWHDACAPPPPDRHAFGCGRALSPISLRGLSLVFRPYQTPRQGLRQRPHC